MPAAVDFLIRNQRVLVLLLGLAATATWFFLRFWSSARAGNSTLRIAARQELQRFARSNLASGAIAIAPLLPALIGSGASFSPDIIRSTSALQFPPLFCSARPTNDKLVVFLHGWNGDPQGTWRNFPSLVCSDPRFQDVDVILVHYPTFMVRRNANLVDLADWVNANLDAGGRREKYVRIATVAHSLGGLIAREMMLLRRLEEDPRFYRIIVAIASPHDGADIASLGAALGIGQPLAGEASQGSSFLANLRKQWEVTKTRPRLYCFTSPQDKIVSPASAVAQCDRSRRHPQWSHVELVKPDGSDDPRYWMPMEAVSEFLHS